ncbi:MAG: stage II sporulation protein R [Oscillospiraceae bacterium]|jgi:stage II sporulation protein R|nr:stage II sporulation protein R [Oscillospiraceae bacterium]
MKKFRGLAFLIGFIGAIVFSNWNSFAGFAKSYDKLQKDVLRLHVIANSDSGEDQALKLKIRDEILKNSGKLFGNAHDIDTAKENVSGKLEEIEELSEIMALNNGYDYDVECELVENMKFDAKDYDDITMPAGTYDALRVKIGDAKGKNWWCVMYPPLCLPICDGEKELPANEYFGEEEYDIIKNPKKYQVKFKILEVLKQLTD